MSGIRIRRKVPPKKVNKSLGLTRKTNRKIVGEDEEQKGCLKFYYKDPKDFRKKNLPCASRMWEQSDGQTSLGTFTNIDDYTPNKMDNYVNKYFSNDRFDGDSPFAFQDDYKDKTSKQVCDRQDFELTPQQKFAGKFISTETSFPGMLVYHGLGSGESLPQLVRQ